MFGGNPEQLEQMMQQMGIDMEELDASEVVITTNNGDELVFDDVSVNKMTGQGQEIYQVMGSPTRYDSESNDNSETVEDAVEEESDENHNNEVQITEDDVELVALRASVDEEAAREALQETDGDLAAAIERLE
jgi:nascent polypeptide-associated complex subunit alpha